MKKRTLGQSDLKVSEVGLGCMSLGTEKQRALSILDEALELGINYLDTADLYDFGLNEEIVGEAIKSRRKDVILATKAGNRWEEGKPGWFWDPSKAYIKEAVKRSLKRLQTDYIDLYQLHGGTIEDNIDETIEAFEELKEEGVIRYYGISSIRPNVIKEYVKKSSIITVMMQYSLLDRRPEEWLPILEENGISVIARGPLAKGLLTEKPVSEANANIKSNGYLSYSYEELVKTKADIEKTAPDLTATETAMKYILAQPAVGAVIPGASKLEQLRENVEAASARPLTEQEIKALRFYTKRDVYTAHRE
ncbi:oxidoreductase [Bacillus glycinifermentans]|uniref:Aldo/keto reductase n=1 Tax=Bacillus glycinifermentans TaxID=1664069 RepID=A0A0J6ENL1_9BACI|nr:aldo/keto reductase [Bacillus glycinifermentans]ATH92261.1 aldo/keto reductase [Bacillus glycinifermentans]KMM58569.1 oxidoreductase [Bacillus glycinifermentans]KRT95010.1 oxidoreductase [Bacillus glycinifermentans]MEC0484780.1 aldo/keto reductase [Bacillus glycinifermentans]MEC0494559.1 aldo/keto reductase [Bacillus glycinifermentans]